MKIEVRATLTGYLELWIGGRQLVGAPGMTFALRCGATSADRDSLVHLLETFARALAEVKVDDQVTPLITNLERETVRT